MALGVKSQLDELIRRNGPITFAEFQSVALYDPEDGFFSGAASTSGAGRGNRDFITSPEVGSLFGVLLARFLDEAWVRLGSPDPFFVVEVGAGNGRLAQTIIKSEPSCASALRYVLVETSERQINEQRRLLSIEPTDEVLGPVVPGQDLDDPPEFLTGAGPLVTALADLPAGAITGVVLANELLDNLPVRVVERSDKSWLEVRVGLDQHSELVEVLVPAPADLEREADLVASDAPVKLGDRLPVPEATEEFLAQVSELLIGGEVVLIDYGATAQQLLARGFSWLRTYSGHTRGSDPYDLPGTRDITCDVPLEYLALLANRAGLVITQETSQAEWLGELGLADLVAEGKAVWNERSSIGDLEALAGRSRVNEAEALTDLSGLGGHRVVILKPR